jgi:hypothetical protein
MMTLSHPHYIDMVGERLLTGEKAIPVLNKYFHGLVTRLQQECEVDKGVPVLEWLPNVAIVVGPMELTLPINEEDD